MVMIYFMGRQDHNKNDNWTRQAKFNFLNLKRTSSGRAWIYEHTLSQLTFELHPCGQGLVYGYRPTSKLADVTCQKVSVESTVYISRPNNEIKTFKASPLPPKPYCRRKIPKLFLSVNQFPFPNAKNRLQNTMNNIKHTQQVPEIRRTKMWWSVIFPTPSLFKMWTNRPFPQPRSTNFCGFERLPLFSSFSHKSYKNIMTSRFCWLQSSWDNNI